MFKLPSYAVVIQYHDDHITVNQPGFVENWVPAGAIHAARLYIAFLDLQNVLTVYYTNSFPMLSDNTYCQRNCCARIN